MRSRALWESFSASRDLKTRSVLIEHYLPLARIAAAKAFGLRPDDSASFDDYLQYARVGLIEAIDRYDATRNVSFETYSTHRIRGAILNGIALQSETAAQRDFWRTRMPERMHSVVEATARNPQRASLQDLIDITVGIAMGLVLDQEESEPVDESTPANPYAATELAQFSTLLKSLVDRLPEREREVVKGHYFERLEFQAIAERLCVTKGRVSQLHARALLRLRELLEQRPKLDRRL